MSNVQKRGGLFYIGDSTPHLYGDRNHKPILGSWNVIRVLNATEINQLAINGKSRELRDLRRTSKMGRLYIYVPPNLP